MNLFAVMGRFTADPELKKTSGGTSVTSFTLAVDRDYVKQGEERQADFLDLVAWGNTAETLCKHCGKGTKITASGRIQTRLYEDKSGNNRKATEFIVDIFNFCERKQESQPKPIDVQKDEPQGRFDEVEDDDLPF